MTVTVKTPPGHDGPRFIFTPARELLRGAPEVTSAPLIVDSWLLEDGAVRALELHESRFCNSCKTLLPELDSETLQGFLRAVRLALPREGRWFPRVEARGGPSPQLALWLRVAPELQQKTRLWLAPEPDPRTQPLIKGPDLPALAALRDRARAAGADDALLSGPDGTVLEAANAAVVWWRGGTLYLPDAADSMLPSVTRTLLFELARRRGTEVLRERMLAVDLPELETWTLNALHGIRPVSALYEGGARRNMQIGQARVREWSAALTALASALDDASRSDARCAPC